MHTFVDIFRIVGHDICAFFSEYEVFEILECLNQEIFGICSHCPTRWRKLVELYNIGQTKFRWNQEHHIASDGGSAARVKPPYCSYSRCDRVSHSCKDSDHASNDRYHNRGNYPPLITSSPTIELLPLNEIPVEALHTIIKSGIIPPAQMGGSHHENIYHWILHPTIQERALFPHDSRDTNMSNARLSPFKKVWECTTVCWFDCVARMRILLQGRYGLFWRVNFRLHFDDSAEERHWTLRLSARPASNRKGPPSLVEEDEPHETNAVIGERFISMDEMLNFRELDWCDLLVGSIDVRSSDEREDLSSSQFAPLAQPLDLTIAFLNHGSTFGRSGHFFDFIYLYPLKDKEPLLCQRNTNDGWNIPVKITINGDLPSSMVSIPLHLVA